MDLLHTPDDRFENLAGYPWAPNYAEVGGIRIHYLDVGEGPVVLLMHGEPSWSYLYRTMIPPLVEAGYRVLAPDLVGFGKSDKPARVEDHTYAAHVEWMLGWLTEIDPDGVTLFGQDWGGLIGLRMVAAQPDRFARIAVANTGLPTGDHRMPEAFSSWQRFALTTETFPVAAIVAGGTVNGISDAAFAAYDAPFPDESFKAGPRVMPALVPTTPDDPASEANRAAWEVLKAWSKPCLTLFSDSDPITAGGERIFQGLVPGCEGQPHRRIEQAGHFLQEDAGPVIADALIGWIR